MFGISPLDKKLLIQQNSLKTMKMLNWFTLALISAFVMAAVVLIVKRGLNEGISSWTWLMYYYAFAAILIGVYLFTTKGSTKVSGFLLSLLIVAAILGILGNVASTQSIKLAPNPGYAMAIVGSQTLLILIASIFLFKSEFTILKGIGTFLVVAGVILLGI